MEALNNWSENAPQLCSLALFYHNALENELFVSVMRNIFLPMLIF